MFTKLASQSDLPGLNEAKEFPCGGKTVCVANVNGEISAMENTPGCCGIKIFMGSSFGS